MSRGITYKKGHGWNQHTVSQIPVLLHFCESRSKHRLPMRYSPFSVLLCKNSWSVLSSRFFSLWCPSPPLCEEEDGHGQALLVLLVPPPPPPAPASPPHSPAGRRQGATDIRWSRSLGRSHHLHREADRASWARYTIQMALVWHCKSRPLQGCRHGLEQCCFLNIHIISIAFK